MSALKPVKSPAFYKIIVVVVILIVWQVLSYCGIWNPMLFPDPVGTLRYAFEHLDFVAGSICRSLTLLLVALSISSVISLTVSSIATQSKRFKIVLETLVAILCPIPGISILPFAMLWFGLGYKPILFMTITGSLAVFTLPIMNGFNTIPSILTDVGKIYGLTRWETVRHIYVPGTLPGIITGLRSAWGLSWRSLIGAELVYGAMGKSAGIGWLISLNRWDLNADGMAVGIASIAVIGLIMEYLIMANVERITVKKWGMKT